MTDGPFFQNPDSRVTVVDPERMNLLGLMLRSVIDRRLANPMTARLTQFLRGDIVVNASGMEVTLRFMKGRVEITREPPAKKPVCEIRGSLAGMLDAALGRNRVRRFMSGELRPRGRPLPLLQLLLLLTGK